MFCVSHASPVVSPALNQSLHNPGSDLYASARVAQTRRWTWRGVSLRSLTLMALGPWLMAMVYLMANVCTYLQAVRAGATPPQQGLIGTLGAMAYVVSALAVGKLVRPQRAVRWLVGSVAAMAAVAMVAFVARPFWLLLVLAMAAGSAASQYFVPFQSRMSHVQPFRTLAWSIAWYNFSWGLGDTLAPATSAVLRDWPALYPMLVVAAFTLLHVCLIVLAGNRRDDAESYPATPAKAFASTPRQRRRGFVTSFAVLVTYSALLSTLYPGLGATRRWSDQQIGLGLMAMAVAFPLTAPIWAWLRRWLEGVGLLLGSVLMCAAALVLLPLTATWVQSLACMFGVGIGVAGVLFHSVYYSNADSANPTHSIGINEAVIGAGALLGPLGLGLIAWSDFAAPRAYFAGAALLVLAAAYVACESARAKHKVLVLGDVG